jgi:hypothetical protein
VTAASADPHVRPTSDRVDGQQDSLPERRDQGDGRECAHRRVRREGEGRCSQSRAEHGDAGLCQAGRPGLEGGQPFSEQVADGEPGTDPCDDAHGVQA